VPIKFIRRPEVRIRTGKPDSTIYEHVKQGLLTPPVNLGGNTSGWPEHEIESINGARLSGATDADIRALVVRLIEQRRSVATAA